jgi:hypothetical protein
MTRIENNRELQPSPGGLSAVFAVSYFYPELTM